jgi:hypothetical protein
MAKKKELAAAVANESLPATLDLDKYAGAGFENVDQDSLAIPFLAALQKGSPQVDKDADTFIKGAEVGDILLTTTGEVFKDEDGVDFVLCGYRRVFLRWAPRESGGGFRGELEADEVNRMKAAGEVTQRENKLFAENADIIRDARVHYVLVVRPDGTFTPAVLSMSSTQIKKSKMMLTQINAITVKNKAGVSVTPPMFSHLFHAETVAESNDQGTWRGWKITRKGYLQSSELFNAAIALHDAIAKKSVHVNYNEAGGSEGSDDPDGKF